MFGIKSEITNIPKPTVRIIVVRISAGAVW
jgi:hypothetical protein